MPKERSVNPVQAQKKADKQKQLSKQKKQVQTQRNEKLARRNPERLQRQIDELKELESRGVLRPKDREDLAQLEKDVRAIRRAREALGDSAPTFRKSEEGGAVRGGRHGESGRDGQRHGQSQNLGKRRRGSDQAHRDEESDSGGDTDPEVRAIPMPRDTPPPIPREFFTDGSQRRGASELGNGPRRPHELPQKPARQAQTTYSSAPQLRDLKKEAVKFLPSAVAQQKRRVKGEGGAKLLEPEEAERLEKAGYYQSTHAESTPAGEAKQQTVYTTARANGGEGDVDIDEEMRKYEAEINGIYSGDEDETTPAGPGRVQVEDVDDEGD